MVSYIAWVRASFKKIVPINKNQAVNLHTNHINVSQRACHFLVASLLMFSTNIFSQQQSPRNAQKTAQTLKISRDFQRQYFETTFGYRRTEIVRYIPENLIIGHVYYIYNYECPYCVAKIVPDYCSDDHLGFFCKKEIQFEDGTSIPLRFRLGSLDYVNRLEGKNNWIQLKE